MSDSLPPKVREYLELSAEWFGYYFGKKVINKQKNIETRDLRAQRKIIKAKIDKLNKDYLEKGKNVRKELKVLYAQLNKVSREIREKNKPFNEQLKPLNQALRVLREAVLPAKLTQLGYTIKPKFQVRKELLEMLKR